MVEPGILHIEETETKEALNTLWIHQLQRSASELQMLRARNSRFTALFTAGRHTSWRVMLLVPILLVCGCSITPKRPSQIPAFASGDEQLMSCPRIVGRYANTGEAYTVNGERMGQVSLSCLLFGADPDCVGAAAVTVEEPEADVIEFQVFNRGQVAAMRLFGKITWWGKWDSRRCSQPYKCAKGFLLIERGSEHNDLLELGVYAAGKDCLLRKGVDGSLIVLQKADLPFSASGDLWYRFPPIEQ